MTTIAKYRTLSPTQVLRAFNSVFPSSPSFPFGSFINTDWVPPVNVEETPEAILVTAELAGVSPDDVEIQLEENVLTISGEKHQEGQGEDSERHMHISERITGGFSRSFTLPRKLDVEGIAADFGDGLLRVSVPKAPETRARRIEVKARV